MEYDNTDNVLRRPKFIGLKLSNFEKLILEQAYIFQFLVKGRSSFTVIVKNRKFLCTFMHNKYSQVNNRLALSTLYFKCELIPYNFRLVRTDEAFSYTPPKISRR